MNIQAWQITDNFKEFFFTIQKIPNKPGVKYSAPNDFGRVIGELLFSKSHPGFSDRFLADVKLIADIEGFQVRETRDVCPVRDYRVMLDKDTFLCTNTSKKVSEAVEKCAAKALYKNDHATFLKAGHKGAIVGNVAIKGKALLIRNEMMASELPPSAKHVYGHIFFEGGNLLSITGPDGKKKVLFGEDNLTVTHLVMRMDGLFNPVDRTSKTYKQEEIRFKDYQNGFSNLFLNGDIPKRLEIYKLMNVKGPLPNVNAAYFEMNKMGLLADAGLDPKDSYKGIDLTGEYMAELQYLKEILIPYEFNVNEKQMIYLPQIDFHISCLMTSGPNGSVLLQDYEQSVLLLEKVKKQLKGAQDLKLLEELLAAAKADGEKVRPVMKAAKERLEESGLTVVPTPGAFSTGKKAVNFFSALSGFSPKTNHYYYIVGGTSVGAELGPLLMDAFATFLKSLSTERIDIYFIGRNPQKPTDFSNVDTLISDPVTTLGVHSLCLETKIKDK